MPDGNLGPVPIGGESKWESVSVTTDRSGR
jgi:hypothetical protein